MDPTKKIVREALKQSNLAYVGEEDQRTFARHLPRRAGRLLMQESDRDKALLGVR